MDNNKLKPIGNNRYTVDDYYTSNGRSDVTIYNPPGTTMWYVTVKYGEVGTYMHTCKGIRNLLKHIEMMNKRWRNNNE